MPLDEVGVGFEVNINPYFPLDFVVSLGFGELIISAGRFLAIFVSVAVGWVGTKLDGYAC
jgi:hypothetical protein